PTPPRPPPPRVPSLGLDRAALHGRLNALTSYLARGLDDHDGRGARCGVRRGGGGRRRGHDGHVGDHDRRREHTSAIELGGGGRACGDRAEPIAFDVVKGGGGPGGPAHVAMTDGRLAWWNPAGGSITSVATADGGDQVVVAHPSGSLLWIDSLDTNGS